MEELNWVDGAYRCHVCGHGFDEWPKGKGMERCPVCNNWVEREQLIGDDEDYAWCY